VDRLLRRLARSGFRRGMDGEHWAWFVIALSAFALRRARRARDAPILSVPIKPGERFVVSLSAPASRRGDPSGT
jgi:hypothetical protein